MFYVYILECADHTLYTGKTTNLEKRLHEHNHCKSGAKYTRSRRPVELKYFEKYETLSEALKREAEIKNLNKKQKEELLSSPQYSSQ